MHDLKKKIFCNEDIFNFLELPVPVKWSYKKRIRKELA